MEERQDPILFLVKNQIRISKAIRQAGDKGIPGAWESMKDTLPELAGVMTINTFRNYSKVVLRVLEILGIEQDLKQDPRLIPKRLDGWGVQFKGGYYRLNKRINGKLKWLHLGRTWDVKTARSKIEAFELD